MLRLIAALTLLCTLAACDTAGPEGPPGPPGPQGNANVQVITTPMTMTVQSGVGVFRLTTPAVTQRLLSDGAALVYYEIDPNVWIGLPTTLTDVGCTVAMVPVLRVGLVEVVEQDACGRSYAYASRLRVVLIAGSNGFVRSEPIPYETLVKRFGLSVE